MVGMPKEAVRVKDKVTIELIEKNTGKVILKKTLHNVITRYGAERQMYQYDALGTVPSAPPVRRVNLYYTGGSTEPPVVSLQGDWGSRVDTGTALQNTLTAVDSTNATYSFRYMGLDVSADVGGWINNYHKYDYGSVVTKGSDQTLRITWTISIPYS
ncbi:hypothetical protein KEJ48_05170 [Candidatus Bathyarchaeota archaeon]|nr:hypothetical protein [Candidatus Bathyarchaeota archaeon]